MAVAAVVAALRRRPELNDASALESATETLSLGGGPDSAFDGGGLPAQGAHEVSAAAPGEEAAAALFALGVATRRLAGEPGRMGLFVQEAEAGNEGGLLYGPGLHALGMDPDRWVMVTARDGPGVLRVVDEATRCGAPAAVVAELRRGAARLDLKTTRRFNLAGARTGTTAVLVTPEPAATSAALTRWSVRAGASRGPAPGLLGAPALQLELTRNRHGRPGTWTVEWNPDERLFQRPAGGLLLARPLADGPFGPGGNEHEGQADRRRRQIG